VDQDERMKAWGLLLRTVAGKPDPGDLCWCLKCVRDRGEKINGIPYEMGRMIVCARCGNKRCPHATDHAEECTNSNAPGQPGSIYE
jgi:hypothetical protein